MMGFSAKVIALFGLCTFGLVGGLVYAWWPATEPLPQLAPIPHLVQCRVSNSVARDLALSSDVQVLTLPPIAGDVRDTLRRRIEREVEAQKGVEVVLPDEATEAPGLITATLQSLSDHWLPELLQATDRPTAMLVAKVDEWIDDTDRVAMEVDWKLVSVSTEPQQLASGKTTEFIEKSWTDGDYARLTVLSWPRVWRFFAWVILACALPIVGSAIHRRILSRESNTINAVLLGAVALPGIVGAWVLTGFASGLGGATATFVAAALAAAFAYLYLSALEEARRA